MKISSLLLTLLFVTGLSAPETTPYAIGDAVQDFALPSTAKTTVSLNDYANEKGVILIFSCNECPYVHKYEQRMIDMHNTYAPQGWPVLAVSSNDAARMKGNSFKNMKKRAKEMDFPFAYVQDKDQEQLRRFGASKTPEVFLLQNVEGQFKLRYTGAIDDHAGNADKVSEKYVENAIAKIEAEEEVTPVSTKVIGCRIRALKSASK